MTVKASSVFSFGSLHSFPPFFTQQPHSATSEAQQATWCKLILDYCQAHRKFTVDWASEEELNSELFHNRTIDRRISSAYLKALLSKLVSQGSAVWDLASGGNRKAGSKPEPTRAIIYWRKPDEWGELIYQWVKETGQNKSILTFYELTESDLAMQTEHRELPINVLRPALKHLINTGRAQVFAGEEGLTGGEGVKFV